MKDTKKSAKDFMKARGKAMFDRVPKELHEMAQKWYPDSEFSKDLHNIMQMEMANVTNGKNTSVVPKLHIICAPMADSDDKRPVHIVVFMDVDFNDPEIKYGTMEAMAKRIAEEKHEVRAVFLVSEAWQASYKEDDKGNYIPPSERDSTEQEARRDYCVCGYGLGYAY